MPLDPPEWAVVDYPARGPVAPMPLSESLGRRRCGCFGGLERVVVLASSAAPVPGTARPVWPRWSKLRLRCSGRVRLNRLAPGGTSSGPGCDWLILCAALASVAAGVGPPVECVANRRLGRGHSMPYPAVPPVARRRAGLDSVPNDGSDSVGPGAGVVPTVSRAGGCPISGAVPVPGCGIRCRIPHPPGARGR